MFMEHWKRRQMRLNYQWDLTGLEDEEVSEARRRAPTPSKRAAKAANYEKGAAQRCRFVVPPEYR